MSKIKDAAAVAQMVCRRMGVVLRDRGIAGTAVYCARNLWSLPRRMPLLLREVTYDRKMGVQTSRLVAASHLGVLPDKLDGVGVNARGTAYMPTPAWAPKAILQDLKLSYPDYTFIDLGSGMGRVVLIAAEFPFRKVVGVEFSEELHRIAQDNLARGSAGRRAAAIELICQDAREYDFPPGNCIVYIFNSFQQNVMNVVLQNLKRSFNERSADLYVIYFNPVHGVLLDTSTFLTKIKITRYYSIYRGEKNRPGPLVPSTEHTALTSNSIRSQNLGLLS